MSSSNFDLNDVYEELEKALLTVGIREILEGKTYEHVLEHFEKIGKLDEFLTYLEIVNMVEELRGKNTTKLEEDFIPDLKLKMKLSEEIGRSGVKKVKKLGFINSYELKLTQGIKSLIESYGFDKVYSSVKELEKHAEGESRLKWRLLKKELEKEGGISIKKKLNLLLLGLAATASAGVLYYQFVYKPMLKRPYLEAGGSDTDAEMFIQTFPEQNGNSTWVELFKYWLKDRKNTEEIYSIFKRSNAKPLKASTDYLKLSNDTTLLLYALKQLSHHASELVKFVEENGYKGTSNALKVLDNFFLAPINTKVKIYKAFIPVYDQIWKDEKIENKDVLFSKVVKSIIDINSTSPLTLPFKRRETIWLLNNATYCGFQSLQGLGNAIKFSENFDVNLNFSNPYIHSALADVGHYFPQIFKYPQETRYLAMQVGDCVYFLDIDGGIKIVEGEGKKDYVWKNLIIPYCKWRFEKLENGSFKSIDWKLSEGELKLLAEKKHPLLVERAARSLYPFDSIMDVDLLGEDPSNIYMIIPKALKIGVKNMSYNETIGCSPFEYIYNWLIKDMEEKNERYKSAFLEALTFYPTFDWPNTYAFWGSIKENKYLIPSKEAKDLLNSDPEIAIIKGYCLAMERYPIPVNQKFRINEQTSPFYSQVIGAMLNRATVVLYAYYPSSPRTFSHSEVFTVGKDGRLIGFWIDLSRFLDDYNPLKNPLVDNYWINNKPKVRLALADNMKSYTFGYESLSKILNEG